MLTINKVILLGRLGRDPERVNTSTGTLMCSISVATDKPGKSSNDQDATEWHRVVAFGNTASFLLESARRGDAVYIEGRIQYSKKDNGYKSDIIANVVSVVSSKQARPSPLPSSAMPSEQEAEYVYEEPPDDLPF